MSELRRTPLYAAHQRLGARLVPFAGYEMPVQYTSILEEHAAVRERAGIFDVSHMGQIRLSGATAMASGERLLSCSVSDLRPGRIRYGLLCNEDGGVVDDVTVYRTSDSSLLLCVNAANVDKDDAWIRAHVLPDTAVDNQSEDTGMLALQGPLSASVLLGLVGPELKTLRRFRFAELELGGARALVSRTGYTGSDGFEIYVDASAVAAVFDAVLEAGGPDGLIPAGLGARDTLRLEAALPLYGHELDDTTSPLEAGLERFVKRDRGGFIGAEAIERRAQAPERALAGFALDDRGIARAGYRLLHAGQPVGVVTSGAPSPTLGKNIGLGYLPPEQSAVGTEIEVEIRGRGARAHVVDTPFVRAGSG
ncbi:MAG: glycine cleavage system aminomethyltransferase GcvT [Proteobacteria bacterium]|nr:glycine cleavage system aminomethyltransferase GcvT [Pseudomonadota bacterium]